MKCVQRDIRRFSEKPELAILLSSIFRRGSGMLSPVEFERQKEMTTDGV